MMAGAGVGVSRIHDPVDSLEFGRTISGLLRIRQGK